MKLTIAALFALSCIHWNVSGTLVELVVRPGDNATLYCDCEMIMGQQIQWVKSCSLQIQPPLIISAYNTLLQPIPRFSVSWNNTSKSYDLVIENITESDLGLYYCARVEERRIKVNGITFSKNVYHSGNTLSKLTYGSPVLPPEYPPCAVCYGWQYWLILLTVCAVCSLLSTLLAFICGYSCRLKTALKKPGHHQNSSDMQRQLSQEQDPNTEVYYASLNIPKRGSKHPKKRNQKSKRLQSSEFSVYDGIKIHT